MDKYKSLAKNRGLSTPGLKRQNEEKTKTMLRVKKQEPVSKHSEGKIHNILTASTSSDVDRFGSPISETRMSKRIKSGSDTSRDTDLDSNPIDTTSSGSEPTSGDSMVPVGWSRKLSRRKTGLSKGKFDVYFYSPKGKRLRSRKDVATILIEENYQLDIDQFDFSVGKETNVKKTARRGTTNKKSNISMEQDVPQSLPLKSVENGVEPVVDAVDIPKGWRRETVQCKSGAKVRYYSPNGEEIRSVKALTSYFTKNKEMNLDPHNFDFTVRDKQSMLTPIIESPIKDDSLTLAAIALELKADAVNDPIDDPNVPEVKPDLRGRDVREVKSKVKPYVRGRDVPEVKSKVKSDVRGRDVPEVKSKVKPDVRGTRGVPEVKPEVKPDVRGRDVPEVKSKVKPEVKPDIRGRDVPEVKSKVKPDVRGARDVPEVKPEVKPEVQETSNVPEVKPKVQGTCVARDYEEDICSPDEKEEIDLKVPRDDLSERVHEKGARLIPQKALPKTLQSTPPRTPQMADQRTPKNHAKNTPQKTLKKTPIKLSSSPSDSSDDQKYHSTSNDREPVLDRNHQPTGWTREVVKRRNGASVGKIDIYFYSPKGKKFRSHKELCAYTQKEKLTLDMSLFDFSVKKAGATKNVDSDGPSDAKRSRDSDEELKADCTTFL